MPILLAETDWAHVLLNPPTLVLGGGMIVAIVSIVGYYWSQVHRDRVNAELKRDMLDRGMTAEQIALVVNSGRDPSETAAKLAKDLAEQGMSAEDIAKVVSAGQPAAAEVPGKAH